MRSVWDCQNGEPGAFRVRRLEQNTDRIPSAFPFQKFKLLELLRSLNFRRHNVRFIKAAEFTWRGVLLEQRVRLPLPALEPTHSLPLTSTLTTFSSATILFTMSLTASLIQCFQWVSPPRVLNSPR